MIKLIKSLLVIIYFLVVYSCEENPIKEDPIKEDPIDIIQEIITAIEIDTLSQIVTELSGDLPVSIYGLQHSIHSRHKDHPGNNLAADYIRQKLQKYGLAVYDQREGRTLRNVYAIQPGKNYPNQQYIFGAHYDSMPDSSYSPGADDNASGCAAVLEAARILSGYMPDYTIIYAFWDEEEQGTLGSNLYATNARNDNDNIRGVINVDMIGWDSNNDGRFYVNVRDTATSVYLSEMLLDVHTDYAFNLEPVVLMPGYGSDNLPFWYFGYGAIGIEEMYGEDWNPNYHTATDLLSAFNNPYFHKCTQILVGTLARLTLP